MRGGFDCFADELRTVTLSGVRQFLGRRVFLGGSRRSNALEPRGGFRRLQLPYCEIGHLFLSSDAFC